MRPRCVRNPIEATAREPINKPNTYERLPKPRRFLNCEQQPAHTFGPKLRIDQAPEPMFTAVFLLEHFKELRIRGKVVVILDGGVA